MPDAPQEGPPSLAAIGLTLGTVAAIVTLILLAYGAI